MFAAQLGQFHADTIKVQTGDFLVQMLGQDIDLVLVFAGVFPQFDLRQHLVGERRGHDEGRVAGGVAKVQQTAFGQQDQTVARRHLDHVDLFLDVGPLVVLERGNLDFIVKVPDVANNRHILHLAHMLDADHVLVAGGGDEDVGGVQHIFQQDNLEPVHRGLQRADRVGFGHFHAGTGTGQRCGRAFANVAIATDNSDLTGHHHVCRAADTVDQRFTAAVLIVELGFGDAVVDVDRGEGQLALLHQIIQTVDTCGGFLGHALDLVAHLGEPTGGLLHPLLDLRLDRDFFFRRWHGDHVFASFGTGAQQDVQGRIAAIIKDQVRAVGELEGFIQVIPMLFQRLPLDRENRRTAFGNRRRRVILGREDVARRPTDIGPQCDKRFDQNSGLDRHMQRADDARTGQRFAVAVFRAQGHQAGHFGFCDIKFLAAIGGKANVFNDVIVGHRGIPFQKIGYVSYI